MDALGVTALASRRRRWAQLQQWARANGWTLVAKPVVDWGARLPGGNKHGVTLALQGAVGGRRTSIGEYSFDESVTTSGGHTTTTHEYVVLVLHLDRPSGYLGVLPCEVVERWGRSLLGLGAPIGDDAFDEHHRVVGEPEKAAYRLPPELIAAHVAGTVPPWTLYGTELVTWCPGRIDLAHLSEQVRPLHLVARLLTGAGPGPASGAGAAG
jgi:hypothetical protein